MYLVLQGGSQKSKELYSKLLRRLKWYVYSGSRLRELQDCPRISHKLEMQRCKVLRDVVRNPGVHWCQLNVLTTGTVELEDKGVFLQRHQHGADGTEFWDNAGISPTSG
ncbi:hypothetical protein FD723_04730 [Nostoc sp. C052]|uniref:hypothetical protein n=1 Tax=Nostoc sp. C052 TaxID=2576902 RepID=UPI0015C3E97B|nr:hypothetical protein [Nostoc sp. C052]QLE39851.1 hypothetical protein FD723_04730 [Nostoc sp. C052]